jgi:hypothetical protein
VDAKLRKVFPTEKYLGSIKERGLFDLSGTDVNRIGLTRRGLLKSTAVLASGLLLRNSSPGVFPKPLQRRDLLLDEMERRACRYFYEQSNPDTGLVLDRARADGRDSRRVASIAATGFGLSALCIAADRRYLPPGLALQRVERTLEFLARRSYNEHGFYFHFLDEVTGERAYRSEVSSVDTAWLLCGVIHARQHFNTARIRVLANEILQRVDWTWMWDGGPTLCQGWTPERGFLPYRWDCYCELLAMYLLAIGSDSHPIPAAAWDAWKRPRVEEAGQPFIYSRAPLFVHQYSHAWLDFRNKRDKYADYFQNSRLATLRHREFCLSLKAKYPWIDQDMWGITASDSRSGYVAWGNPIDAEEIDGTLVPCAAGGSLVFLPDECSQVLETMLTRYGKQVWTRYGFVDAFQPQADWSSPDVLGIDLGIMLLMAENLRSESLWNEMMSAPEVQRGFRAAGFEHYTAA